MKLNPDTKPFGNILSYIKSNNPLREYFLIEEALGSIKGDEARLLNYGSTQLIFLTGNTIITMNQPGVEIEQEFHNLQELGKINPNKIITPFEFRTYKEKQFFFSPYEKNAKCVYSRHDKPWGVYEPKDTYHYEELRSAKSIQEAIIALLIYFHRNEKGITKTKIAGDDFILKSNTQDLPEQILPNMKLISARERMNIPFQDYLNLIRKEFQNGTYYNTDFVVNQKSGRPMSKETIERGITKGIELRLS